MSWSGAGDVAKALYAVGFRGQALIDLLAISGRESGFNPGAVGDVGLQDSTWGPSVGLFQIRTLRSQTGTGGARDINRLSNNPLQQAKAAFEISNGGRDLSPWNLHGGSPLAGTNVAAATQIANSTDLGGPLGTFTPGSSSSSSAASSAPAKTAGLPNLTDPSSILDWLGNLGSDAAGTAAGTLAKALAKPLLTVAFVAAGLGLLVLGARETVKPALQAKQQQLSDQAGPALAAAAAAG